MTQLQQPFNPAAVDPTQGGLGNMPLGKYPVVIVGSQLKATADQTGGMLVLELQKQDGASGVMRLNLYNANDQARQIAEKQLSAICHAVGYFQILENVQAIYGKPFGVDVQLQKGEDAAAKGYTEVKRILNADGSDIVALGQTASPTPPPPPAQTPAATPAAAGWGAGQAQTPAASPAAATPAAGGWNQGGAAGGAAKPAWGK